MAILLVPNKIAYYRTAYWSAKMKKKIKPALNQFLTYLTNYLEERQNINVIMF